MVRLATHEMHIMPRGVRAPGDVEWCLSHALGGVQWARDIKDCRACPQSCRGRGRVELTQQRFQRHRQIILSTWASRCGNGKQELTVVTPAPFDNRGLHDTLWARRVNHGNCRRTSGCGSDGIQAYRFRVTRADAADPAADAIPPTTGT